VTAESITSFFGDRRRGDTPDVPLDPELTPEQAALIAETCSKSGVLWLRPSDGVRDQLAWHVWHDDAVHVVYGVDEQMLPLLSGAVEVTARSKDNGTRLVRFLARAELLEARSPAWESAADALSASRLNARDTAEQRERWASGGLISRLVPVRLLASGPGEQASPVGAEPPARTGATTANWRPWHLGGRPRQRRGTPTHT
jgi:hypothetical protein